MARKVFISVLGASFYEKSRYGKTETGFVSNETRFVQQATLEYLGAKEWNENDVAYILLTDKAKTENWNKTITKRKHHTRGEEDYVGLEKVIEDMSLPFFTVPLSIEDGNNEDEMWSIFQKLYENLQEGDQLYFDLTHSFRYIPMLVLVLGNYAKFLKHTAVCSITYGNYEVGRLREDKISPIIDLLPLTMLQDWTFATADYLKNGNADRFSELSHSYKKSIFLGERTGNKTDAIALDDLIKSLKDVTDDLQTCRGKHILFPKHFTELKKKITQVGRTVIEPLNPVVQKIEDAFNSFSATENGKEEPLYENGFKAAEWCLEHRLYQQAATILQENVISFFCGRHQIVLDIAKDREKVNTAFAYQRLLQASKTTEKEKDEIKRCIEASDVLKGLMEDPLLCDEKVYMAFSLLTEERNDINHNGMRKEPHKPDAIRRNIEKAFEALHSKLKDEF